MEERQFLFNGKLFTESQLIEKYGESWGEKAQQHGIEEAYKYGDKVFSESQLREKYGDDYLTVSAEKGITPFGQQTTPDTEVAEVADEKKNPDQNEDGESNLEDTSLDSPEAEPTSEPVPQDNNDVPLDEEKRSIGADMWDSLKANTKTAIANIAGIPNFINKAIFSVIAPKELEDYMNTLSPDEREAFMNRSLQMMQPTGGGANIMGHLGEKGGDEQEELNKSAEDIRSKMTKYDASITEDLGKGEFAQAGRRIAVEGVGAIPSIVQSMIPAVGLASLGAATAAGKQEKLEDAGEDFGGKTIINSALTGTVESLLEKYTANQGKRLLKSLAGKGKDVVAKGVGGFMKGLGEVAKGGLKEGTTEGLQAASENLIDALTTGNEKKAFEIFTEISDSFLIGFAVGAPMKGGEVAADAIHQTIKGKEDSKQEVQSTPEGGTTELNIPHEKSIEELKTQLDYITNKEGMDSDVRAKLMKDLGAEITALEKGTENQAVTTPENSVDENKQANDADIEIIPDSQDTELSKEEEIPPTTTNGTTELRKIGEQSRKQAANKGISKKEKRERVIESALDKTIDRQGSAKRKIRKGGLENTVDFMVANSGASSNAKNISQKAYKRTVDKLTDTEVSRLEEIIFARRVQAIDENRSTRGLEAVKHPNGYNSAKAQADLDAYKQELGTKKFNDLMERSDNYFDEYKSLLSTMKDEGLISQESYETFAEVNYQPRQFLDFLEDMHGNFLVEELNKAESIPLSQKQIKSLKEGSDGMLNMDAFGILESSILTRSQAVFSNRMNKTFAEEFTKRVKAIEALKESENLTAKQRNEIADFKRLSDNVKVDRIIGFTESGQPKYALAKANTKGWSPLHYYKDGVKHRIWLKDEFYGKFTDTNNQYINATAKENIALFTGTSTVKTLATGNNPLFFLTNTPRDFLFILGFSKEYGAEVISNSVKLFIDASKGLKDVVTNSKNYDTYLEYGGGMDYLALQGKYKSKGFLKKTVDKVMNQKTQKNISENAVKTFLDKFNLASEVGLRMAVFNRSIKNQLKELKVKDIESLPKAQKDIVYTKAVRSARELTDFNQGGKVTKALDAGIPYLNAAVQGTRAAASNFKKRPLETAVRLTQVTAYTVGLSISAAMGAISYFREDDEETKDMNNSQIYFETLKGVSEYDLRNYFIIPLGSKDKKGEWEYLRIAKAQSISPAINTAEFYVRKKLAESTGVQYKQDLGDILVKTIETNILPIEPNLKAVGRIPAVDAYVGGILGIDSYTGNPLSWDRGKIPAELEGIVDKNVEPMYKSLGESIGHSPVRLQSAVESYITTPSTNPYVGIAYGVGNMFSSKGDASFNEGLRDLGNKSIRRLMKSTSEYNKIAKAKGRTNDKVIESYRKHIEVENIVRSSVKEAKQSGDLNLAITGLEKAFKEQPDLLGKSMKWFESEMKKKRLHPIVSSLRFEENKEVRAILLADEFGDNLLKSTSNYSEREKAILRELITEKVVDGEVYKYYVDIFK